MDAGDFDRECVQREVGAKTVGHFIAYARSSGTRNRSAACRERGAVTDRQSPCRLQPHCAPSTRPHPKRRSVAPRPLLCPAGPSRTALPRFGWSPQWRPRITTRRIASSAAKARANPCERLYLTSPALRPCRCATGFPAAQSFKAARVTDGCLLPSRRRARTLRTQMPERIWRRRAPALRNFTQPTNCPSAS